MLIKTFCDIVWSMIPCMAALFKFPSKGVDLIKKKINPKRSYLMMCFGNKQTNPTVYLFLCCNSLFECRPSESGKQTPHCYHKALHFVSVAQSFPVLWNLCGTSSEGGCQCTVWTHAENTGCRV